MLYSQLGDEVGKGLGSLGGKISAKGSGFHIEQSGYFFQGYFIPEMVQGIIINDIDAVCFHIFGLILEFIIVQKRIILSLGQ